MYKVVGRVGGTLIFSNIRRLRYFLGFKTLNFNIFGDFQKNEYFWGYEDFVDIFGGSSQKGSFLCILGSYLKFKVQNGE